jgi:DnaJ-class molecular chaperone
MREQAKKYHPDVNTEDPDAKDKFAEVSNAFSSSDFKCVFLL